MQPTLLDIEHSRALWAEHSRVAAVSPTGSARARRRGVARVLALAAARLDHEAAWTAVALGPAAMGGARALGPAPVRRP
jgi:hypothetical protein